MKRKLTKDDYGKLTPELQKLYKADGEIFVLELEDDDTGALERAKEREKLARKAADDKVKALTDELAELRASLDDSAQDQVRKAGDVKALDESWKAKFAKQQAEHEKALGVRNQQLTSLLVDQTAATLAKEISTVPSLMAEHIRKRLTADLDGDTPATRVLGPDGKVSAASLEDLKKELLDDKSLASVMIGSQASGGSAIPGRRQTPGSSLGAKGTTVDLSRISPAALVRELGGTPAKRN